LDLKKISGSRVLQWRRITRPDGKNVFEVYRKFIPAGPHGGMGMMRRHMQMMGRRSQPNRQENENISELPQIIFVGLDMSPIEEAHKADVRHAVIMGAILLLVGFTGFTLLFLVQSYRSTRASLSRIKAFSDNVVEHVPIGLIALDNQGKIAAFNNGAESILQLSAPEVMGQEASRIIPAELLDEIIHSKSHNDVIEKEIECKIPEGKMVPIEIAASSLEDEDGVFLGNVLLFGRLAAGVAHEIRNPLSSIKGFATYFKERYPDRPQDQQTANIMIQEVDRLNRVVGQLLEFARPIPLKTKRISLQALLKDSIKLIEDRAAAKGISVQTQHAVGVDSALGDPDRINQILLNLYLNAIEAMEGGGELKVALSSDSEDSEIYIRISDTGRGITPEHLSKIFDPYGLGLAIAHNIAKALGGKITVESHTEVGTTFTVVLPKSEESNNHD
jgi:two-component system sensor histidine kinase HydH